VFGFDYDYHEYDNHQPDVYSEFELKTDYHRHLIDVETLHHGKISEQLVVAMIDVEVQDWISGYDLPNKLCSIIPGAMRWLGVDGLVNDEQMKKEQSPAHKQGMLTVGLHVEGGDDNDTDNDEVKSTTDESATGHVFGKYYTPDELRSMMATSINYAWNNWLAAVEEEGPDDEIESVLSGKSMLMFYLITY
jgi:hypothetical protein